MPIAPYKIRIKRRRLTHKNTNWHSSRAFGRRKNRIADCIFTLPDYRHISNIEILAQRQQKHSYRQQQLVTRHNGTRKEETEKQQRYRCYCTKRVILFEQQFRIRNRIQEGQKERREKEETEESKDDRSRVK